MPRKPKADDKSKFYLASRYYLFTYKTHIPKEEMSAFFDEKARCHVKCAVGHETGQSTGVPYEHTHVAVDFDRSMRRQITADFFDFKGIHPNMKPCKGRNSFSDMVLYITKEDYSVFYSTVEVVDSTFIAALRSLPRPELLEIMREATWRDASAIRSALDVHDRLYERERQGAPAPWPLRDWQNYILYKIYAEPADRLVHWWADFTGGAGKTEFAKWLVTNYNGIGYVNACGSARDFTTYLEGEIDPASGRNLDLILFDFTRANEDRGIYDCIELVSNGIFNSLKFRGRLVILPTKVRVVVFANFLPNRSRMSVDRWRIYLVQKGEPTSVMSTMPDEHGAYQPQPLPLIRISPDQRRKFEDLSDSESEGNSPAGPPAAPVTSRTPTFPVVPTPLPPPAAISQPASTANPWGAVPPTTVWPMPVPVTESLERQETNMSGDEPETDPEPWEGQ